MRAVLCLLCVFLAVACRREKRSDPNYDKAAKLYQQLFAAELDDAYGDPKMDEVVALLKKVDKHSLDADAAQTMLHAIDHGREELVKSRAARASMVAAASASMQAPAPNIDPTQVLAASAEDAGAAKDPYAVGTPIAEVNTATGGCLVDAERFHEQGTGVTGTTYRMSKSPACAEKLPGFIGQLVLVADGRIYRRVPDPGPPALAAAAPPDAGPAAPARPRPSPAAAPDAGEPGFYYPGQPQGPADATDAGQ